MILDLELSSFLIRLLNTFSSLYLNAISFRTGSEKSIHSQDLIRIPFYIETRFPYLFRAVMDILHPKSDVVLS